MAGRILVAYATKHGSTAGVAEAVARELTAAGLEAEGAAFPAADSLEGYDGIVLGAPLYTGRSPRPRSVRRTTPGRALGR